MTRSSAARRCQGMHRFLIVEEWNELGATVSCLSCDNTFSPDTNILENFYVYFRHYSGTDGPSGDRELLVLATLL